MQYASTERIIAAMGDEWSLTDSEANDVFEHVFVKEERSRPNESKRTGRLRSHRLPGKNTTFRMRNVG